MAITVSLAEISEDLEMEEEFEGVTIAINKALKKNKESFMLSAPMVLTVKNAHGYSKSNHIGSEDFKPLRAYLGNKSKIVYVFKPVMTTDYQEMEMEEAQAKQHLIGFKEFITIAMSTVKNEMEDFHKAAANRQEQESLKDRFETYKSIGFGSW